MLEFEQKSRKVNDTSNIESHFEYSGTITVMCKPMSSLAQWLNDKSTKISIAKRTRIQTRKLM